MTKEQEELLLKDLCARLPYGVKALATQYRDDAPPLIDIVVTINLKNLDEFLNNSDDYDIKSYLFPLSSMTEEQKEELHKLWDSNMSTALDCAIIGDELKSGLHQLTAAKKVNEWCYENHFDINGLIPLDLAIDATGLNIY